MDFKKLKIQSLIAFRGNKTQMQISKKLGFGYNQVYRWESDRTQINWADFVRFCQVCKIPLFEAFQSTLNYKKDISDQSAVITHFIKGMKKKDVAKQLGITEISFSKIISNSNAINLELMFKLIYIHSNSFYEMYLQLFADLDQIPIVKEISTKRKGLRDLIYDNPMIASVQMFLTLECYLNLKVHSDALIAKRLGMTEVEVHHLLKILEEKNAIEFKDNKYKSLIQHVNIDSDFEKVASVKQYWLHRHIESLESFKKINSYPTYSKGTQGVGSVNEVTYQKIVELYSEFNKKFGLLIEGEENSKDLTRIICFSTQWLDLFEAEGFNSDSIQH